MEVLVVGLGSIAKKHIDALKRINPQTVIYALRSQKSADNYPGVKNIFSLNDINTEQLSFVIISNPTAQHYDSIVEMINLGKPLFIEKPLFDQITDKTEALVTDIISKNIPTYVACNLRFLHTIQNLKNLLKQERINEVNAYCGSYLPDWRPGQDFRKVYSANKEMGGGVNIDLIHELDYIYWLFGEPKTTQSFFSNQSSLDISAYDYANYLWQYEGFSASIILNYYRRDSKRNIEIVTSNNTFFVDLLSNKIYKNDEVIYASEQKISDTYLDQMSFFIENIVNNKQQFNTVIEANIILKLCMKD